jgi:tetratricopeptide (TPR) repeat protein
MLLASARCLEHGGPPEPYMPMLEALTRLGRGPGGQQVVETLARFAPTWLAQLPALVEQKHLEAVRARTLGAVPERMLREMVDAIEALARATPLVIFLDDLHWSDAATIALLGHLARRDDSAPLLVVGTSRPGRDAPLHGLIRELRPRGRCVEVAVRPLASDDVCAYLSERFPGAEALAPLVHGRTGGNPLFLECLLGWWAETGALAHDDGAWRVRRTEEELAHDVPESVRQLLEQEVESLARDDTRLLEAAACVGRQFSAASAAAGAAVETEHAEARCMELARRCHFLREAGIAHWPDGTVASRFAFVHDLHRQVLYERIPAARRRRLHGDIGSRLESGYATDAPAHAVELAAHFVQARELDRGARYLQLAARQALARGAYEDGVADLRTALELVTNLPDSPERDRHSLSVEAALGGALLGMGSWSAAEPVLRSALALARRLSDASMAASLLYELAGLAEYRGQYSTSARLLDEALGLDEGHADPARLVERHELMACSLFHQAAFDAAIEHADRALTFERPDQVYPLPALYGEHPAVSACGWAALSLWCLGSPGAALERIDAAIGLAGDPARQYSLARAHVDAARLHHLRREPEQMLEHAEIATALATERGHAYQAAFATILLGWALAAIGRREDGLERLRDGLDAFRATGAGADGPYLLALLADASGGETGLAAAREALESVDPDRPFFYDAELHRLRGELALSVRGERDRARESFRHALAIARRQHARSLELRAAVSLARLLRDEGSTVAAADVVHEATTLLVHDMQARDLDEARSLAAALGGDRSAR